MYGKCSLVRDYSSCRLTASPTRLDDGLSFIKAARSWPLPSNCQLQLLHILLQGKAKLMTNLATHSNVLLLSTTKEIFSKLKGW